MQQRALKIIVLPLFVSLLAVAALLMPGSTAARAAGPEEFLLVANSGQTPLLIDSQGHNNPAVLTSSGAIWDFTNEQRWTLPGTTDIVNVVEIQNGIGNNECLNVQYLGIEVYVDSCETGDKSELWYPIPTGSTTNGQPNYWYVSVIGTNDVWPDGGGYEFLTANSLTAGSTLIYEHSDEGGLAAWEQDCYIDC